MPQLTRVLDIRQQARAGGQCGLTRAESPIKESDDVGRSQRADRARKAKRKVKSGQGDKGDR